MGRIGDGLEVEAVGVGSADDHGEGVFEAEAGFDLNLEALIVELRDGVEDGGGVACGWERLLEDGGEGGAAVLDVGVDAAGDESLMAEVAAREIEAAFDFVGCGLRRRRRLRSAGRGARRGLLVR